MFPGQGSQKKGMGKDLFELFPDQIKAADEILGYSLAELCLEDTDDRLKKTQFTQPALYVVSALTYLKHREETGVQPDFAAGHSLGEYPALFCAGAFDFETGLKLVQKRGELMSRAGEGGMAAVMKLDYAGIRQILDQNQFDSIDVANFNSPQQIVLSGPTDDIARAKPIFEAAGVSYVIIKVTSAFHSRYMQEAQEEFARFLDEFEFRPLGLPVISNVEARPYEDHRIREMLALQITHSVKWTDTIRYLMARGEDEFIEMGPGNVLKGLLRNIRQQAEPMVLEGEPEPESGGVVFTDGLPQVVPESLGSAAFRRDYGIKYAYLAGALDNGVSSAEFVINMAKAGLIGFLGTGGMALEEIEAAIKRIRSQLSGGQAYGMNLLCNLEEPEVEESTVELFLQQGIDKIEASSFLQMTPSLVRFRLSGLAKGENGEVIARNRIIAKVTRPEIALTFMSPAPERIVRKLVETGKLTAEEAELAGSIPMSHDICVQADSGGFTDRGNPYALLPAILALRDQKMNEAGYSQRIRVGATGGIGTPEAAAAAFVLGADFIRTGSINLATVEARTSEVVKDMLQEMGVQDTDYAPAADMFEIGSKVQVLKKGVFFPARANKLYALYQHYGSLEEIDPKRTSQVQEKYFHKSFDEVWEELKATRFKDRPEEIEKAGQNPKHKMALVFKWYLALANRLALEGARDRVVDFQVPCGPALGAFNQWVQGGQWEKNWRARHPGAIAARLMKETAVLLSLRLRQLTGSLTTPN